MGWAPRVNGTEATAGRADGHLERVLGTRPARRWGNGDGCWWPPRRAAAAAQGAGAARRCGTATGPPRDGKGRRFREPTSGHWGREAYKAVGA